MEALLGVGRGEHCCPIMDQLMMPLLEARHLPQLKQKLRHTDPSAPVRWSGLETPVDSVTEAGSGLLETFGRSLQAWMGGDAHAPAHVDKDLLLVMMDPSRIQAWTDGPHTSALTKFCDVVLRDAVYAPNAHHPHFRASFMAFHMHWGAQGLRHVTPMDLLQPQALPHHLMQLIFHAIKGQAVTEHSQWSLVHLTSAPSLHALRQGEHRGFFESVK